MIKINCNTTSIPVLHRLATGYWHLRWNDNQWMQWPVSTEPTMDDVFGWPVQNCLAIASHMISLEQTAEPRKPR